VYPFVSKAQAFAEFRAIFDGAGAARSPFVNKAQAYTEFKAIFGP
jgi:hypothetical protein